MAMYVHTASKPPEYLHWHPLLFSPVLSAQNIFSLLFANTLWLAAIAYYIYVTFLGYTGKLPSQQKPLVPRLI